MGNSMKKSDMLAFEQHYQNKMKQRLRKKFKLPQGSTMAYNAEDTDEGLCYSTGPGETNSQNTLYIVKVSNKIQYKNRKP